MDKKYFVIDDVLYELRVVMEWGGSAACQGTGMGFPSTYSIPSCLGCGQVMPSEKANMEFIKEAIGHKDDCPIKEALGG